MSIGEFEEVGDVVKGFISDDATVVVGTVIDPDMTEDMRVTVIVTGLGDVRRNNQQHAPGKARLVETRRDDGSLDYEQLDRPAVIRKQSATSSSGKASVKHNSEAESDVDYLDIPAFLRRQEEG
jgi:cell division protein FtsZ